MSFYGLGVVQTGVISGARDPNGYALVRAAVVPHRGEGLARVTLPPDQASALLAELDFYVNAYQEALASGSATALARGSSIATRSIRAHGYAQTILNNANRGRGAFVHTIIGIVEIVEELKRVLTTAQARNEPVPQRAVTAISADPARSPDEVPRPPTNIFGDILSSPVTPIVGIGVAVLGLGLWMRARS